MFSWFKEEIYIASGPTHLAGAVREGTVTDMLFPWLEFFINEPDMERSLVGWGWSAFLLIQETIPIFLTIDTPQWDDHLTCKSMLAGLVAAEKFIQATFFLYGEYRFLAWQVAGWINDDVEKGRL